MRAAGRVAAGATAVLLLAGCSAATSDAPAATTAEVRTEASCLDPDVLDALGLELDESLRTRAPAPVTRGLPPEGFVAETALVCDRGETLRDSAGRWRAVTATLLEGDLDPLVDLVAGTTTVAACGTGVVAQVWLVDAMGAAVLLPRDAACAGDELAVALADLGVVDRTEHPVALAQPVAGASS
ncbi:hypothetical protein [Cellulomonas wangsupingiae]|uniref:DUF3558 domain-containing protein n=1 Tax=Cellulomonas wangsupingiae TaxID=2968085 RepID=A0ABY5K143_9CELL|nr:hypothetical protein [Cellulomonas wangsupingiae]MCC2335935.1 hypothetical protein [Cellulomonas wangsupingiae]UUI64159.1 hypothetical protein NP075_13605 [Cellulomonas wangsupingiae]